MELTSWPKLLWTSDNKLLHHHFPDVFATVHTTQDIPEEASFGPCMLQNTLLDTVAFIALKCSERRNIHYVFKVGEPGILYCTGKAVTSPRLLWIALLGRWRWHGI